MTGQTTTRPGVDLRLFAVVVLASIAILVLRTLVGRADAPFFADTDDAMRMVMVRDFLAGQSWYDLTAHRLNTPFGAEIHWSRLIDLPIGLLVLLFTPFLGAQAALISAGYAWPLLLLAILLWLSARLALTLVGPQGVLPALVLPVLSPAIIAEFNPGRVDHHNVVIILTLATAWAAVEAVRRPRFAALCGMLAATGLAIATEFLPALAAAILAVGLLFVVDADKRVAMRNFGLALGLGSLAHLALFRPPARWLEPACDVISPVYVSVTVLVGVVFAVASLVPAPRHPFQRLLLLGVPGLVGMAAVAWRFPLCLKGPYGALDPWLQANWIAGIVEAKPWLANLSDMPAYAIAVGLPALLAIVVMVARLWRVRQDRAQWATLLVFLLATALIMLVQVRGARLAIMPAIPAAAWLIVMARQRYLGRQSLANVAALLGSWLAFSGIVLALVVGGVLLLLPQRSSEISFGTAAAQACLVPSAFTDLAGLAPERVMSPIDLGAHIMLYTPHAVVAAPYHRNQQGVRDAFRFFNEPIATARSILAERGIGLVVLCPAMPEMAGIPGRATDSFVNLYASGQLPGWLADVNLPSSPLKVYAVLP